MRNECNGLYDSFYFVGVVIFFMGSGIPSGDVDASFPSRKRTQEHLPPSERISDIEDSNNDVMYGICFHSAWFNSDNYSYHGDDSR